MHGIPYRLPGTHYAARKNVLLLSCMDLRLADDTVGFMNSDNLANRYDHVILAGAALGALQPNWKQTFLDHLDLAMEMHHVHDLYILEHRQCGAYQKILKKKYANSDFDQKREERDHRRQALKLVREVRRHLKGQNPAGELGIKCFLMDLRGGVECFYEKFHSGDRRSK